MEEIKKEKKPTHVRSEREFHPHGRVGGIDCHRILLMGGGATTEETFNPDIFSTMRTAVGPGISFIGFVIMFCNII